MVTVSDTKDKVQRFLTQMASVNIDENGRYSIRHGSARVFVSVEELGDDHTWVKLVCPLVWEATISPELYEYIALNSDLYKYGTLSLVVDNDDSSKASIFFTYGMLGTTLDPDELQLAVGLIANTADELDDELKKQFNGKRFHED